MRSSQRGVSYWGILFGVSFFALMIKVAATVGPMYLDYMTIDKMLQAQFRDTQVDKFELTQFSKDLAAQMDRMNACVWPLPCTNGARRIDRIP